MTTSLTRERELATELLGVLEKISLAEEQLITLSGRRQEILTSLNDGSKPLAASSPTVEAKSTPKSKPVASKKAGVEPVPDITPEAQADYEQQDELYAAGIEKITDAQGRMIFALLKDIDGDVAKKSIIKGIIAEQHHGWRLESTKDLSKVWAGDVITYLQNHTTEQLQQFVVPF